MKRTIVALCLAAVVPAAVPLRASAEAPALRPVARSGGVYHANIAEQTRHNTAFRRVLHTGARTQLVVMSLPPGGDIGVETHRHVEQTFFVQSGHGLAVLGGVVSSLGPGDALMVPPGTEHNVVNNGRVPLQLYTLYSPPNHLDGRVHRTQADARADAADEAFGQRVR